MGGVQRLRLRLADSVSCREERGVTTNPAAAPRRGSNGYRLSLKSARPRAAASPIETVSRPAGILYRSPIRFPR